MEAVRRGGAVLAVLALSGCRNLLRTIEQRLAGLVFHVDIRTVFNQDLYYLDNVLGFS